MSGILDGIFKVFKYFFVEFNTLKFEQQLININIKLQPINAAINVINQSR